MLSTLPRKKSARDRVCTSVYALLMLLIAQRAWAIEVYPGDYTALEAGTDIGVLYYETAQRNQSWVSGHRQSGDPRLTSTVAIARYIHFMKVGGVLTDPQLVVPYGQLDGDKDIASLGNHPGFGDPALVTSVWLINDPAKQRYLAITPYLFLPLGSYDKHSALNLGDNRWSWAVQAGYIQPVGPFMLDLTADSRWFADNHDCAAACGSETSRTLSQAPLYSLQASLRLPVSHTTTLFVGGGRILGGETEIDGNQEHDRQATTNMRLGVSQFLSRTTMLTVAYGRDLEVENGFRETDRVNLRFNFAF